MDSRNYQRKKARSRAASKTLVAAGQDIGALPPVRSHANRERSERDFRFFCDTYFPHLFTLAWSPDHLRVLVKMERVVLDNDTLAVAMPRGSGKTTLCQVAVLWAILTGRHGFVLLISGTQDDALSLLENIKKHLASNDSLLADYPEAVYPIRCLEGETRRCRGQRYYGIPTQIEWGAEQIVMPSLPDSRCSGSIIRVSGIGGHIRGALYVQPDGNQVRPSLAICDDPQTDESAASEDQSAKRMRIINGAVRGLAGPGKRVGVIIPCTVIQQGDLADQLLDRQKQPHWHGERTKMIYAFPTDEKPWAEYFRLRDESLRVDGNGHEATEFYRQRRAEMDAGSMVAWPERYLSEQGEISAVQHAMNLRHDNEHAFYAEYQNEPLRPTALRLSIITPDGVSEKANGRPQREVPLACTKLTMFIDVHDRLLYYCVCAWQDDFTGYVIDYGTFPEQNEPVFSLDNSRKTLGRSFPGVGPDAAIQAGLEKLVSTYLAMDFRRGAGLMRIDRLLVDMGYKPGIVAAVKHKAGGATMMLCRGLGIRAGNKPMSGYVRRPGETIGFHFHVPNVRQTAEFPHVASDVNFWKSFAHEHLAIAPGDPGSLSLFGEGRRHELFAQHIANSEYWDETQGHGRTVHEWKQLPGRPDNHWLDCLVGCCMAASLVGIRLPTELASKRKPRRPQAAPAVDMGFRPELG